MRTIGFYWFLSYVREPEKRVSAGAHNYWCGKVAYAGMARATTVLLSLSHPLKWYTTTILVGQIALLEP